MPDTTTDRPIAQLMRIMARLRDPETGETLDIDTSDRRVRAAYAAAAGARNEAIRGMLRRLGIDDIPINTRDSFIEPLLKFFRARETRAARR